MKLIMFLAKGLQLRDSDEMRRFWQIEFPPQKKNKNKAAKTLLSVNR